MTMNHSRSLIALVLVIFFLIDSPLAVAGVDLDVEIEKLPLIIVDGDKDRYTKIRTKQLKFYTRVAAYYPKHTVAKQGFSIFFEGKRAKRVKNKEGINTFAIVVPYAKPRSRTVANERLSVVTICNQNLFGRTGEKREKMLRQGLGPFMLYDAYEMSARLEYTYKDGLNLKPGWMRKRRKVPVRVLCGNLVGPKPRTHTTTTGGAGPRTRRYQPPPVIAELTLRTEPAAVELVNGERCPTELKLYGYVRASRAFKGNAIFFGPGYLSRPNELNFKGEGNATVRATYPIKWNVQNGLAAPGVKRYVNTQSVALTLNVADPNNKVVESTGRQEIKVVCRRMRR